MAYFDDIIFVYGNAYHACTLNLDISSPDRYCLGYVENGNVYYGFDDGKPDELSVPFAFWHHPRHRYQYGSGDGKPWSLHFLRMMGDRARRMIETGLIPLSVNFCLPVLDPVLFHGIFHELLDAVEDSDHQRQPYAVACLEKLVALLTEWSQPGNLPKLYRPEIDELAFKIRQEPLPDYDFPQEAARMGLSYSHFRMLFRQRLGRAPHDYLLSERMRLAAELLKKSGRQIKEVALLLNYKDPARFSRMFKNKIGRSPQQYCRGLRN